MCTAVTYNADSFYFGRTLDNEFSFGEKVTVTPRKYIFEFTNGRKISSHYAIAGMAYVRDNYPLYFDAMNEEGLCMAGLNFVKNASFGNEMKDCDNIAVYEFIPWILSQCKNVSDAIHLLEKINLIDKPFSKDLPTAQLHWIIADRKQTLTVENMKDGLHIHNNPVGVLTNNPSFPYQMHNLNNFMHLSAKDPLNNFSQDVDFTIYSKGMGATGLPGDWSSQSRFVRAAFVKSNSSHDETENSAVSQFFHILGSVNQVRGCTRTKDGNEFTVYTSCMNADKGIYYYTTYGNRRISAVDMHREDLDSDKLKSYNLIKKEQIYFHGVDLC